MAARATIASTAHPARNDERFGDIVCVSLGRMVWLRLMRTLRQSRNVFVTVLAAPSVGVNLSVSVIGGPEGFFFRSALPAAVTRTTTLTVVALPVRPDPVATVTVLVFLCLPVPCGSSLPRTMPMSTGG